MPTSKVYNKNKLDNDLNNFFRLKKLKAHFKDSINRDIDDQNRLFKANKQDLTPDKKHHTSGTFVEGVDKDIECTKTFRSKKSHPNVDKGERGNSKSIQKGRYHH